MSAPPRSPGDGPSSRLPPDYDYPRPSLAETTVSTARTHSSSTFGWEQSPGLSNDIRGDLAAGWGGMGSRPLPSGGGSPLGGPRGGGQAVAAGVAANNDNNDVDDEWGWRLQNKSVHPVPSFYPMDPRSTRKVYLESTHPNQGGMEEKTSAQLPHSIEEVSLRISTACQSLSVHGLWDNHSPTATLSSMERVEMEINLYLGDGKTLLEGGLHLF